MGIVWIFSVGLRVVSNFGDRLWGGRNTRARAKFRGDATRGERQKNFWRSPRVRSSRNFVRARVCISPAPQSPSPKLETTRRLIFCNNDMHYGVP